MTHPPIRRMDIGETRYDVRFPENVAEEEMLGDDFGRTFPRRQLIMLARDQGPDQLRDTLIHEVFHAVIADTALGRVPVETEDGEEVLVREITPGWFGVLRRNPKFVAYIQGRD